MVLVSKSNAHATASLPHGQNKQSLPFIQGQHGEEIFDLTQTATYFVPLHLLISEAYAAPFARYPTGYGDGC